MNTIDTTATIYNKKVVDLNQHLELEQIQTTINHQSFMDFAERNQHKAVVKDYKPRPFVPEDSLRQSVMTQYLGYNEHNTTEVNWGIEPEDDAEFKDMLGDDFFAEVGLRKETCMVRLLQYNPGQCIPLHTDSYNGFKNRFGEDGIVKRWFVAISDWDWGHFIPNT